MLLDNFFSTYYIYAPWQTYVLLSNQTSIQVIDTLISTGRLKIYSSYIK